MLKRLTARHAKLFEYMVVGAGNKYSRLLYAEVAHEPEIVLGGAYPRGYLGEFKSQLTAGVERLAVVLTVNKELGGADYPLGTAQAGKHFVYVNYLLG